MIKGDSIWDPCVGTVIMCGLGLLGLGSGPFEGNIQGQLKGFQRVP